MVSRTMRSAADIAGCGCPPDAAGVHPGALAVNAACRRRAQRRARQEEARPAPSSVQRQLALGVALRRKLRKN